MRTELIAPTLSALTALVVFGSGISASRATEVPSNRAILDVDFPDPAVIRASDGWYYAYATNTESEGENPRMLNVQVARSRDLDHWEHMGDALPVKPLWAQTTQTFWAPDVIERDGKFFMYYSGERDIGGGLCLAVATSLSPLGPFTDVGSPMQCAPQGFTEIDPMAYDDPATGKRYLYWGSGWGPIRVRELAPNRIEFAQGSPELALIHPVPNGPKKSYFKLIEGAWTIRQDGWYYMFFSGDSCCDPAHYAVMIARSRHATGPFEVRRSPKTGTETLIVQASKRFNAPGHNSVVDDSSGKKWLVYHGIDNRRPFLDNPIQLDRFVRRVMLKDELCFRDGWPTLEGC